MPYTVLLTFDCLIVDAVHMVLSGMDMSVEELVCYGLGNFTSCLIARYQLAFMICLRDKLQVNYHCDLNLYEPLMLTSTFCGNERNEF